MRLRQRRQRVLTVSSRQRGSTLTPFESVRLPERLAGSFPACVRTYPALLGGDFNLQFAQTRGRRYVVISYTSLTKEWRDRRPPQVLLRTSGGSDDPATRNTRASVEATGPAVLARSRRLPNPAAPPARTLTPIAHRGCPSGFYGCNRRIKRTMVTRLLVSGSCSSLAARLLAYEL